jgi:hypothetical protein
MDNGMQTRAIDDMLHKRRDINGEVIDIFQKI